MLFLHLLCDDDKLRLVFPRIFLHDSGDAHIVLSEHAGNLCEDAGTVLHLHPQEKLIFHLSEIFHRDLPVACAADPSRTVIGQIPRRVDHLSDYCARRGHLPRAGSIEHGGDDCGAVERLGKTVYLTEGDETNLKITTPADLILAEALLRAREERL